jgi:predicted XRE-type DNA-binding protein
MNIIRARRMMAEALHRICEMQKRILEDIEVQYRSDNVFADLGLPDAERLKIKTGLVVEIRKAIRALGLT